ncbi:HIL-like protein [Mya arenaria]|uniref:HIL-like protein n=1 Tax=Mya arenaria TaxID=6604 RepID=A0ABY7DWL1_MYAAR|nr:hillarin-like [Mya arenaria]WAR00484.1 HIL-like protein [Mya arenaria]
MGSGNSRAARPRSSVRFMPREPLQERFTIPEVEEGYPPIKHATTPKKDIYDPKTNRDIYFHARNAPRSVEDSWESLVGYLTSIYRTDMMKVRSIFSWLGVQEMETDSYLFVSNPSSVEDSTPRGYKKVIANREGSYATMFALICRKAGIKCAVINGISKGFGYGVGETDVTQLRDRWNAVYVDGWRFIHPLWAFKNIISYKRGRWVPGAQADRNKVVLEDITDEDSAQTVDHDFNEYYFFVEPEELISVCLPDDARWQMVTPNINTETWIHLPLLMKRFHMEGFKISGEFKSSLKTKDGVCGLVVRSPKSDDIEYQLAHDFFFNYTGDRPIFEEAIFLRNFLLMARDAKEKKWIFEARMPIAGTYRITVYGGPSTQTTLPWICDVAIVCDEPMNKLKPYPDTPPLGFGPVSMTEMYGLSNPSHPNGMLFIKPRQTYHITFKLNKTIKTKAKMIGKHVDKDEMEKWVKCTINNQSSHSIVDIMVHLQREGEYSLRVYGKAREISGRKKWENIVNYYLSTDPPRENGLIVKDKAYKTATEINARKALEEARKGKDLYELKTAISQFEQKGFKEEAGDFGKASLKMEYLELAKGLKDAINRRNYELLVKSIEKAESSCHSERLTNLIANAQEVLQGLAPWNKFLHDVLEMRQSTISELTSYLTPSSAVHDVLTATLVMLGNNSEDLKKWDNVKIRFKRTGSESILRRVREFDPTTLTEEIKAEVSGLLAPYTEETVLTSSAGAATFYKWMASILGITSMVEQEVATD